MRRSEVSSHVRVWSVATPTQRDDLSPEFGRFWWGEAVSGFGTAITALALQTLVLVTLDGGAAQVGWLNSVRWLPYLVLGMVVGALVDRVRRRPVMVGTDLARAALLGLIPLAWAFDVLTFPLLLVVVLLFGTVSLINDAASLSFIPRLVRAPRAAAGACPPRRSQRRGTDRGTRDRRRPDPGCGSATGGARGCR